MISLRNVQITDLEQLILIENEGFSIEEAATKEAFIERIQLIPDTFIVAEKEGKSLVILMALSFINLISRIIFLRKSKRIQNEEDIRVY